MKQIITISIIAMQLIGMQGCTEPQASPNQTNKSLATTNSQYTAVAKGRVDLEGGIVRLASSREGVIQRVLVEEGDQVKKGQLLAIVDDKSAQVNLLVAHKEYQQARSAEPVLSLRLKAAERELKRQELLLPLEAAPRMNYDSAVDQVALTKAEIDQARANTASAQSRLKVAEYEVEQRRIRSPLDGVIVKRLARVGDGVSTTNVTPLFLFAPNAPRIVRAELEERYVSQVKSGMMAVISSEANESISYPAKVLRVGQVFNQKQVDDDPNERVDVRAVEVVLQPLDTSADQSLLLGQRVLVKIQQG